MKPIKEITFYAFLWITAMACTKQQETQKSFSEPTAQKPTIKTHEAATPRPKVPKLLHRQISSTKTEQQIDSTTKPLIEPSLTLSELYERLDVAPQRFTFNSANDTSFITASGTIFEIRANSFTTTDDKPVVGNVSFAVKEYTDKASFILGNLSSTSGTTQLESGGMFQLKVQTQEGKECKLKKGSKVDMNVPVQSQASTDMEVFYGNHEPQSRVDWKSSRKKVKLVRKIRPRVRTVALNSSISIIETSKDSEIYKLMAQKDYEDQIRKTSEDIDTIKMEVDVTKNGIIKQTNVWMNGKLQKRKVPRFKRYKQNMISIGSWEVEDKILNFNKQYFIELPGLDKFHSFSLRKEYFANTSYKKKDKESVYKIVWQSVYVAKDTVVSRLEVENIRRANRSTPKDSTEVKNAQDMSYYALGATQLDWINIDRFYHSNRPKVDMHIANIPQGTDLKLVFTGINSILYPNGYGNTFSYIPKGYEVVLIAIEMQGSQPKLATKKLNTFNGTITDLTFETMTIEGLKQRIHTLF